MINKWIWVTTGGVSSLLLGGASAKYAPEAVAFFKNRNDDDTDDSPEEEKTEEVSQQEAGMPENELQETLQVADVSDEMPFREAFATARDEVGAGGVFYWHGGIYSTYYKEEWNAMSAEEKKDFGDLANDMFPAPENPENAIGPLHAENIVEEPQVTETEMEGGGKDTAASKTDGREQGFAAKDTKDTEAGQKPAEDADTAGSNPQVLEEGTIDGHLASTVDVNGDGKADYTLVDADDSGDISPDDLVIDKEGNVFNASGEYQGNLHDDADEDTAGSNPQVLEEGTIDGHLASTVDVNGDGKADYILVDADDSGDISPDDLVIDKEGNVANASGEHLGNLHEDAEYDKAKNDAQDNGNDGDKENVEANNDAPVNNGEDEVAIVGYGEYDGHLVVGYDSKGDGETDFVIIDVDDDGTLSPDDLVVTEDGKVASLADIEAAENDFNDVSDDITDDITDNADGIVSL